MFLLVIHRALWRPIFLFAQRSWQTQPLATASGLTLFMGKRIRLARASLANGGV